MNANVKLISSGLILGARTLSMASKLVLSIFIVKNLGLVSMGIYGMAVGASTIMPTFLRLGMFNVICRDAVSSGSEAIGLNLRNYATLMLLFYIVIGTIALIYGLAADNLLGVALIVGILFTEHTIQDFYNLSNSLRMQTLANLIVSISATVWSAAYVVCALYWPQFRSIEFVFIFWAASIIPALILSYPLLRYFRARTSTSGRLSLRRWTKKTVKQSLPFFVGQMSTSISYFADRYILAFAMDLRAVGIYVFFWQIGSSMFNLINSGAIQLHAPELIAAFDQRDDKQIRKVFYSCLIWAGAEGLLLSALLIAVLPLLIALMSKPEVLTYLNIIYFILAGQLIRIISDVLGLKLLSMRRDMAIMLGEVLLLTLTICFSTLGIYFLGLYGAALATMGVYFCVAVFRFFASRNLSNTPV